LPLCGAVLLAAYTSWSGCSRSLPTAARQGTLQIELRLPQPRSARAATSPAGSISNVYDSVTVAVFADPGGDSLPPLVKQTCPVQSGTNEYQLDLTVPPSPRYRIQAEVYGLRYRNVDSPTGRGLQFMGTAIAELAAGGAHAVIPLIDVVPRGRAYIYVAADTDSVAWDAVPGAVRYSLYYYCDGPCGPVAVSRDAHFFLTSYETTSDTYALGAEFSGGLRSAMSEPFYEGSLPPRLFSLTPDSIDVGAQQSFSIGVIARGTGFDRGSILSGFSAVGLQQVGPTQVLDRDRIAFILSGGCTGNRTDSIFVRQFDGQESERVPFRFVNSPCGPLPSGPNTSSPSASARHANGFGRPQLPRLTAHAPYR
jgi:hypothetical protein